MLASVKNLHLALWLCIYLKSKQKIDVIILSLGFREDLGDTIMNPTLMGFYAS